MYAVPASYFDGSMLLTVPRDSMPGMLRVTLVHVRPPSRVSCTSPSFVPTQIKPACTRDSAIAKMVLPYSTPMLSGVRPPEICCMLLSFSVRSGLMTCQLRPPFVVTCTCWLPTYTLLRSCGEIVRGIVQMNLYFTSAAAAPPVRSGQTSTLWPCRVRSSNRTTMPPRLPDPEELDQMMFGSTGSGVARPPSPPPTACHSLRSIVPPLLLLLGPRHDGPSCWLP